MKHLLGALALSTVACAAQAQVMETPDIAAALRSMGTELSKEVVGGTMKLYGPLHAAEDMSGFSVTTDQAYGDHERHKLDVFAPDGASGAPVLVFVHGGGFVRGDKGDVANIGREMARHGIVGVTINYRFAPDNMWPAGAEDLSAALGWIRANIAAHGGDPTRIIIAGNSAGSMHVADYTFREELQSENDGVIGAVLISTPTTDLTAREIDPKRDALYYGTDGDRAAQSVVNALDGRTLPVMVAYAEYEPGVILDQTRILIEALAKRDGRMPLVASAPGHNHISIVEHIGTADKTLGDDIVEFVSTVSGRAE